ncbi:MAG: C25 family cysteine peptidase [candidate division WOR-3 bacterium]
MRLKIKSLIITFIFQILSAQLLVITPDDFYNNIQPLVQWKKEKGYNLFLRKISEIGSTAPQIKSYIQHLADSTNLRYTLLVGAINKIPSFDLPGPPTGVTDYYYGCLTDELVADVLVGRLPASNTSELDVMVAKILSYEKNPPTADTLYFKRALMVATSYVGGSGTPAVTALETKRLLRRNLLASGFLMVDTVFHPPSTTGESISSAVNRGVLYVNGRGWGNSDGWEYPRFDRNDVGNLNNGFKLPVVTSFYCATGNFARNPCFGEVWLRAGTPTQPKGGVLFFGPSYTTTSTRWNNFLDCAVYDAIFNKGITTAGEVFLYAKKELIRNFPLPSDSLDLRIHIQSYNILGDPTLSLWRGVPKTLYPNHPQNLAVGTQRVRVSTNLESCLVSFYSTEGPPQADWTNREGEIYLDLNLPQPGSITLTITKRDYLPYQVSLPVELREFHCGLFSYEISSPSPGTQDVYLTVKNYGTSPLSNVSGILRSDGTKAQVLDSLLSFGDIPPQATSRFGPLRVLIKETAKDKESLSFSLLLNSGGRSFSTGFKIEVHSTAFTFLSARVSDGNNQILEPGEDVSLYLKIKNTGREGGEVSGVLRALTDAGFFSDSIANFGYFSPNEEKENLDPFNFYLSTDFTGNRKLKFRLFLYVNNNLKESLDFLLSTGPYEERKPYGPSLYGYYAYENNDNHPQRPNYFWREIDPNYGGSGERLNLTDDGIVTLSLPFPFRYFGIEFNQISVSANGYCVLGASEFKSPYNFNLPSPYSPTNLLAIFWDDFRPDTLNASGVYHYYDSENHIYIIEWSRVHHIHGFRNRILGELQTFEICLFDPQFYPTRTGDGEIIYQYLYCQNDDSFPGDCHNYATVGILSPSGSDYLLVTFANQYPIGISPLGPERAIKFTTNPPDTFSLLREREREEKRVFPTITKMRDFLDKYGKTEKEIKIYNALGKRVFLEGKKRIGPGIYYLIMEKRRIKIIVP